jgi:hypothetical protein
MLLSCALCHRRPGCNYDCHGRKNDSHSHPHPFGTVKRFVQKCPAQEDCHDRIHIRVGRNVESLTFRFRNSRRRSR